MFTLVKSQIQRMKFLLVNPATGQNIEGLGANFEIMLNKGNLAGWSGGIGAKNEIGDGWYYYDLTATETDTVGQLAINCYDPTFTTLYQSLVYEVVSSRGTCIQFTYTVTDDVTLLPIADCNIWITLDLPGTNTIWNGTTDTFGVARDASGSVPCLDAGTYYFWRSKVGYTFVNPDTEVISNP